MKKHYSIGEFAELIGKTKQTLRNWDKIDILKLAFVTDGGHRMYSQKQLNQVLGIEPHKRTIVGYCRVSSRKQKDDLERQIKYVKEYMIAKGYQFEIITDIGSGINYNNKDLNKMIDMVMDRKVSKIVIFYKDRLVRFGFELIENICTKFGTEIEIIDNTEKAEEQELVEDLIQIVTAFSCKLQGKRANKAKKVLRELKKND